LKARNNISLADQMWGVCDNAMNSRIVLRNGYLKQIKRGLRALHYRWKAHKVTLFTTSVLTIKSHHMS